MDGKTKRQASKDSRQIGRLEMSGAVRHFMDSRRDAILDDLVDIAMSVLHHDASDGSDVDLYERRVLRERFTGALNEHGY